MEGPDLNDWWYEPEPNELRCLACRQCFSERALIRTFVVLQPNRYQGKPPKCSRVIKVDETSHVLLFDRHLDCIETAQIRLIAISHVWDPKVSLTQQRQRHFPQDLEARKNVTEEPIRIFRGFNESSEEHSGEFWHDYFSVPQWTDGLKNQILLVIHDIFNRATTTVIFLKDIFPGLLDQLNYGATSKARLAGITGVCNAQWFKRMWTAMEFVRSGPVRMMTGDYHLVKGSDDPIFLDKLYEVWNQEVANVGGDVHKVEHGVGMHFGNLVPWNLGPLREVRSAKGLNFAMAFALLSKRRCRDKIDFLHGLRGITKTSGKPMEKDFYPELLSIARACLLQGDYSPLLMTPKMTLYDPRKGLGDALNFNDVWTWELGSETCPPLYPEGVGLDLKGLDLLAQLEPIGTVDMIIEPAWHADDPWIHLKSCLEITVTVTGLDLDSFIATLGPRLFGTDKELTIKHLQERNLISGVQDALKSHHEMCWWYPWRVKSLGLEGWPVLH